MSRRQSQPKEAAVPSARRETLPAEPTSALDRPDALGAYMAQLRHHAPISREEEHALAVRWVEEGDMDAARELVMANVRLVVKIAMEYRRAWTNVLDLIQEGNVGLMQAVHRFDPYQGVKLSSYAVYWIRAYILKYLIDNIRLVRMGSSRAERKLFFRLNKEKRALEAQGFQAEPALLAERLDVSEDDVRSMEQRLGDDDSRSLGDTLAHESTSPESDVGDRQLRRVFLEKVKGFLDTLDERERLIVESRVLADEPHTLQELGDELSLTRERVRQIEAGVVKRLREHLKSELVDFEYYAPAPD
ncbi:MAG: sigma-70 family RNA polymerase sigma factor [Deltaproteobacteria bacterium]|nr:sigma-70 family RNA polymerase sigma factor [Deltaproteobacteria bacterium]